MLNLSKRNAIILAVVLSIVMWATRGHHVATLTHLPDASWAIFILLGLYFRHRVLLPVFLAQAALIDYLSITQFGVNDYCVTLAYAFLLPAYSALWLVGRWYATRYQLNAHTLHIFAVAAVVGTAGCELISSGSFYFLGGRFADTSLAEFATRLMLYFPGDLVNATLYLSIAMIIHVLIANAQHPTTAQ